MKNGIKIKESKPNDFRLFGLRFEVWNISTGTYLSIDTKTTRYVIKLFKYCGKSLVADLI